MDSWEGEYVKFANTSRFHGINESARKPKQLFPLSPSREALVKTHKFHLMMLPDELNMSFQF